VTAAIGNSTRGVEGGSLQPKRAAHDTPFF
jgi:hypothetical protein